MKSTAYKHSGVPKGSGSIKIENNAFGLLGITGRKRAELKNIIESKGGKVCRPGSDTGYIIYDPLKAKRTKYWFRALERRDMGDLYLMKPELFFAWTDPDYRIEDQSFTVQISFCRHLLKYPDDWKYDEYGKAEEIRQIMFRRANRIINNFAEEERRFYLLELYFEWGHKNRDKWFRRIMPGKLSLHGKIALVSDYLNQPDIWENAEHSLKRKIEKYLNTNITELSDNLFSTNKFNILCLYFDHLAKIEKEWIKTGYSDGYFVYNLVNRFLERAIESNEKEPISCLLNYKAAHFDSEFIEAAEDHQMDVDFGVIPRTASYYVKGETISFGAYLQSDRKGAIAEPIEWEVLKQEEGKVLILSKKAIASGNMEVGFNSVKWETSLVRNWLENEFLNKAFTEEERGRIVTVVNKNPGNRKWKTKPEKDTHDRAFLLTIEEVKKYFPNNESRIKKVTPYAKRSRLADNDGNCIWWLRTVGFGRNNMSYVSSDGMVNDFGDLSSNVFCICPALWMRV